MTTQARRRPIERMGTSYPCCSRMRACRTSPAAIDQYENLSNLPKQETLDKPCHTLGVWVWQWQWQDRMQGDRVYVVAWNSCTGEVVHVDALVGGAGSSGCDRINIAPFNYNGRRIQARAAAAQLPEREGLAGAIGSQCRPERSGAALPFRLYTTTTCGGTQARRRPILTTRPSA